jgi:hypothetical protein
MFSPGTCAGWRFLVFYAKLFDSSGLHAVQGVYTNNSMKSRVRARLCQVKSRSIDEYDDRTEGN